MQIYCIRIKRDVQKPTCEIFSSFNCVILTILGDLKTALLRCALKGPMKSVFIKLYFLVLLYWLVWSKNNLKCFFVSSGLLIVYLIIKNPPPPPFFEVLTKCSWLLAELGGMVWCQTSGNGLIIIEGQVVPVIVQCTLSVVMYIQTHFKPESRENYSTKS